MLAFPQKRADSSGSHKPHAPRSMKPADLLLAVAVMLVWGINFVAAKMGLAELPPILLMSIRFATVAVILLPFARLPHGRLRGIAVLSTLLGCAHFSFMF